MIPDESHNAENPADSMVADGDDRARRQVELYLGSVGDFGQLLIDASLDMIIAVDLALRIVEFNPAAERAFGYAKAEVLGQSIELLYAEPQSAWRVRSAGFRDGFSGVVLNRRKSGEVFPSRLCCRALRSRDDGDVIGMMGISRDITAEAAEEARRETYTRELEEARARADTESAAKNLFLAHVSHEVRTPLTAILGYAEQLLHADLSERERRAAAETINRNGAHLLSVINDILDLSKIEAGKLTIEPADCAPADLIEDVVELMRARAAAKDVALELRWRGRIPATIRTDATRLRQILLNLVGNAIKFTAAGAVRVSVRLDARSTEPRLRFDVLDSGPGVAREHREAIFEPFRQADVSTSRCFGGTGLGLAISRRLARALGGDVTVARARLGFGSCFRASVATGPLEGVPTVTQPPPRRSAAGPAPGALALSGLRILLAEDGPDNQRLIAYVLRRAGAEVTVVSNGRDAVHSAMAAFRGRRFGDSGRPFDALVMDMQMPQMDGYEAVRELRRQGYSRAIVALTAHALLGDREKCLAAGCDGFATKPIEHASLLRAIREASQRRGWLARGEPRSAAAVVPG